MEEAAVSKNNHGGARLPTFNHRRYNPKYGFQAGGEGVKSNAPMEGLREGSIRLLKNPPSWERPGRREESKN
jgi:hypothetical protein